VELPESLDRIAFAWNRIVSKDRDLWFFGAMVLSASVSFLPFSRDTSFSNFFVYALLPIVLVFANREKFREVPGPAGKELFLALSLISGAFVFNWVYGTVTGSGSFGLTDYVVLVVGTFALFYSVSDSIVRFGTVVLIVLRGGTLALSAAYPVLLVGVSAFFVAIVVVLSNLLISDAIEAGSVAGQIVIRGPSGPSVVGIGWGCAGLEELLLISVILYVLIHSFGLARRRLAIWLSIGIAGSFVINIIRMVILIWVAYRYGITDMLWLHTHLGDALFLVWIGVFWVLFFRVARPTEQKPSSRPDTS